VENLRNSRLKTAKSSRNTGRKMELGPIYTMAKCHNHEFVRALETHSKALLWRIEIE
jgi:hypothetical protein